MTPRHLVLLAVLAVVSVGAAAAVLRTGTTSIASDRRGERVLPALAAKPNDITGVMVRQGGEPLSIDRRDGGFVAADTGFPIKADSVRDLIAGSIDLTFEEARTADPARYNDLGLADPGATEGAGKRVVVRSAGGDLADFVIGNRDTGVGGAGGGMFVRLTGQPQTWLARGNVRLPSRRADWFEAVDLGVKRDDIKKVVLTGGGRDGVTITVGADKPGELVIEGVPEGRVADTGKLARLTALVEGFSFDDVRKRSPAAADPRRVTIDIGDAMRLTVAAASDPGWVQISVEPVGDARREQVSAIAAKVAGYDFRLPADRAELIGWTMDDLTNEQKS
ncbi:MAG: DUF4340 domain-containing protein [Hyphomicrobiales bacterium]|nr:DUF4340 domain-containing protein [Hyphomicrobiales bacterium]